VINASPAPGSQRYVMYQASPVQGSAQGWQPAYVPPAYSPPPGSQGGYGGYASGAPYGAAVSSDSSSPYYGVPVGQVVATPAAGAAVGESVVVATPAGAPYMATPYYPTAPTAPTAPGAAASGSASSAAPAS